MTRSGPSTPASLAGHQPIAGDAGSGGDDPISGGDRPRDGRPARGGTRMGRLLARLRPDAGMNTAEYAVGTLAAVAFAGLLLKVLTSSSVQAALSAVIARALK